MNTRTRLIGLLVICFLLVQTFLPALVLAEDIPPASLPDITLSSSTLSEAANPTISRPAGAVDCFQYYKFGSIQVDVEPSVLSTVSGTPLTFSGLITNSNPYPIIDGTVMVKIFKTDSQNDSAVHSSGYPVVDQFFALEHVTLPALGTKSVSFDWNVPGYALSGDYELHTFFMTSRRFNLLGLPFTDDVTGNKVPFSIVGQTTGQVFFDKYTVKTNDRPYYFASYPPQFTVKEPVTVTANVVNTTKVAQTVVVSWKLFNWAGESTSNLLDSKSEKIVILPGSEKKISYTAVKERGTVSFVQGEVVYKDTKSLLNVRFTREGFTDTRLNFPSTLTYPLIAGQEAGIFSCLHSTGAPIVDGGKLTIDVKDVSGAIIHTYTYEGAVTGDMMGVKDSFTPSKSLSDFDVTATLWNNGSKIEEVTIPYRCSDIDPALCIDNKTEAVGSAGTENVVGLPAHFYRIIWIIGGVVLVLVAVLVWMIRRRMITRTAVSNSPATLPGDFIILLLVILGGVLALPLMTFAKSISYSTSDIPTLYQYFHWDDGLFDNNDHYWNKAVSPGSAQVTYKAQLVDTTTGNAIATGAGVPVGTKIKVEHIPYSGTDIHWVGSGYGFDSPYGYWFKDAGPAHGWKNGPPGHENANPDFIGIYTGGSFCRGNTSYYYTLLDIDPPTPEVVNPSSNLSCSGNICLVTDKGPISVSMRFPETFGQFYFRYYVTHLYWNSFACPANLSLGFHVSEPPMSANGSDNNGYHAPYKLVVPEQTISFNARGFAVSAKPAEVQVTPLKSNSNLTDENQGFDIYSTDPDNNQIRYGIDWDSSGNIDQWLPGSGYVDSGTTKRVFHKWINPGTFTFRTWAQDSTGRLSDPVDTDITITQPPPTATIDVTDCVIAIGQKTCISDVAWMFDHADAPYVVRNNTTDTLVGSDMSGSNSTILNYDDNIFIAKSNGVTLNTTHVQVFCAAGAVWDTVTDACMANHIPELSLWTSHDVIRMKATTTLEWKISDMVSNTCRISGPSLAQPYTIPTANKTGSLDVGGITSVSVFTLTCSSDLHDDITASETVEVIPSVIEI